MTYEIVQYMANIVLLTAMLCLIYYLVMWVGPRMVRDYFGLKMASLRNDLLVRASESNDVKNHPAYSLLLRTMTGYVRGGNKLTLPSIILANTLLRDRAFDSHRFERRWDEAMEVGDTAINEELSEFKRRMHRICFKKVLVGWAPLLPVIFVVIAVVAFIHTLIIECKRRSPHTPPGTIIRYPAKEEMMDYMGRPIQRMDTAALMYASKERQQQRIPIPA